MTGVFMIEAYENAGSPQDQTVTGVQVIAASACVGMTALERVHFFPRQLVTADDLTQEQNYFRNKLRRHNRLLHGWGIVCGALVSMSDNTSSADAIVGPGYILGPYGDEIVIDRSITLDLTAYISEDCLNQNCIEIEQNGGRVGQSLYYIAVKYAECMSKPVQVNTGICGCDELQCEYSRIRDHYEIGLLTQLPSTYNPMPDPVTDYCGKSCPACPGDPWVILAAVSYSDQNFSIALSETWQLRRHVRSHAQDYYTCEGQSDTPQRLSDQTPG